jgi:hypothetical protein
MNDILWRPSTSQIEASRMDAFRRRVNLRFNLQLDDYAACTAGASSTVPRSGRPSVNTSTCAGIRRKPGAERGPDARGSPMPP